MKKQNKGLSCLVATSLLFAATASAMEYNPTFYVGIGGSYNMTQKGNLQDSLNQSITGWRTGLANATRQQMQENRPAMNAIVGISLVSCFGLELSYNIVFPAKAYASDGDLETAKLKFKQYSYNFDAVAQTPIDDNFSLIGTLGMGYLKQSFSLDATSQFNNDPLNNSLKSVLNTYNEQSKGSIVPRLGIGLGYTVEDVSVRIVGRYIPIMSKMTIANTKDKFIKDNISVGADIIYYFF